ncbi:MAG TPA: hypothetical protein VGI99_15190, partial [Gemmataceae bacterium]
MVPRRDESHYEEEYDQRANNEDRLAALETTRSASAPVPVRADKREEEKMSLFWRVFGGTILSIVALVFITLYNNLANGMGELRNDLSREREARASLARKDDIEARMKSQYDRLRAVEGFKADIEAIKERGTSNAAAAEAVRKDLGTSIDSLKKDTASIEVLKERIVTLEGLKKEIAGIDALKEKLATLSTDLKSARDEVQKAHQELEKNKAADLERKSARDAQSKQLDETLKDL